MKNLKKTASNCIFIERYYVGLMTKIMSKLIIGGVVIVTLLMLFSTVPVAAENSENDDIEYEAISVNADKDGKGEIYDWTWDCKSLTMTLRGTVYADYIVINNYPDGEPGFLTVTVLGDVILDDGGFLNINGSFTGAKITGGGKITLANDGYDIGYHGTGDFTIDGISLNLLCGNISSQSNLIIQNCPSVIVSYPECPVHSQGSIKIINSNINISRYGLGSDLISSADGITMPYEPTSSDSTLVFDGSSDNKWESGVTKTINSTVFEGYCSLTMESYVSPPDDSISVYDVTLYSVVAAAVVLLGIGCVYAGKH